MTRPVSAEVAAAAAIMFAAGASERTVAKKLKIGASTAHRVRARLRDGAGQREVPEVPPAADNAPAVDGERGNGDAGAQPAAALAWDPWLGTDGVDDPDAAMVIREVWTRTRRMIDAERALTIGRSLIAGGVPAGVHAHEYVRRAVMGMPAGELAELAGVASVPPARPVVAVPDPGLDAELGKLQARRAARADRLAVWEPRAAEARRQLDQIEADRAQALDRGDDDVAFADRRRDQSGRLEDAEEACRLLGKDLAVIDRLIGSRLAELAAEGQRLQAQADADVEAHEVAAESARRIEAGRPTARQLAEQRARAAQIEADNAELEREARQGSVPTAAEMRARVLAQQQANQPRVVTAH